MRRYVKRRADILPALRANAEQAGWARRQNDGFVESNRSRIDDGQKVRVTNGGGRQHTFTQVANLGGGFVPPLNGALVTAPECANPGVLTFLPYKDSQTLTGLTPGLHLYQCCIHPWMRAAIRVN